MPRAYSQSRRRIRALAAGVPLSQASDAPEAVVWSKKKVTQMGIDVVIDPELHSSIYVSEDAAGDVEDAPTEASTPADAQAALDRVEGILDELGSEVPY